MAVQHLSPDDYVGLYKFFQTRADTIKSAMFASVTWVVGFAAAVLAFVVATFVDFSGTNITVAHPRVGIAFCGVGVVLCIYALFLLYDSAAHIRGNWDRADRCAERIQGLRELTLGSKGGKRRLMVWHRMGLVVVGFLVAHVVLMVALWVAAPPEAPGAGPVAERIGQWAELGVPSPTR